MKRITHDKDARDNLLHIETELGIINIRVKLSDRNGRKVESIELLPDTSNGVVVNPQIHNMRFIKVK